MTYDMAPPPVTPIPPGRAGSHSQAPDGLASILNQPPNWLIALLAAVAIVSAVLVAQKVASRDGRWIKYDEQYNMLIIAGTAVLVSSATVAAINLLDEPFWFDVGLGFVIGYGAVLACQLPPVRRVGQRLIADPDARFAAAWATLAGSVILVPYVVAVDGVGTSLGGGSYALFGLCALMVVVSLIHAQADWQ